MESQGRFAVIPAAWLEREDMDPASIVVLCVLASYANRDGWCWPSLDRIAKVARRSKSWASRAIDRLELAGLVEVKRTGRVSRYRLKTDAGLASEGSRVAQAEIRVAPTQLRIAPAQLEHTKRTQPKNNVLSIGFPEDGGISYTPWAEVARRAGKGWDVDVLATRFRTFCRERDIAFNNPTIAKTFETWCGRQKGAAA